MTLVAFLLSMAGCAANNNEIKRGFSFRGDGKFAEEKLAYSKGERAYKYDGEILLDETGRKIRSKDDAIVRLRVLSDYKAMSTAEQAAFSPMYVYIVLLIPLAVVNYVLTLPAVPYMLYADSKTKKESFESYSHGDALLKSGEREKARTSFVKALKINPAMAQNSDVYFKIAETYEGEGGRDMAETYYRMFLDYSFRLYPGYFEKYGGKEYANDLSRLGREFDSAEEKLGSRPM